MFYCQWIHVLVALPAVLEYLSVPLNTVKKGGFTDVGMMMHLEQLEFEHSRTKPILILIMNPALS